MRRGRFMETVRLQHPKTDAELETAREAEEKLLVDPVNESLARIAALEEKVSELEKK
jgi:hypothetical protein